MNEQGLSDVAQSAALGAVATDALQIELAEARQIIADLQRQLGQTGRKDGASTGPQGEDALRYQARLLDLTYDAIFVRAVDGTIRYWNRGAEVMYGWSAGEALGRTTSDLLRTVYPVSFEQTLAAVLTFGHWEGELVHTRRDESKVIVESRWTVERDAQGEPLTVLEINTDITEQKHRTEELLRLHEQVRAQAVQLDEILSASPDQFYTFDHEGRYLYANHAAGVALARQPAEMIGKTWRKLGFPPDIMSPFADNLAQVFATDQPVSGEVKFPSQGQMRDFEYVLGPIHDSSGTVEKVLVTVRDITERRRVENELRLSQQRLRDFSRLLVTATENERQAIARELHDEAGQWLTSLKVGLSLLQRDPECPAAFGPRLVELKDMADGVLDGLRRLAMDLRPGALDRAGLVPAVEQFVESFRQQTGLQVHFAYEGLVEGRLPSEVETALYRIVQETLTNVVRHAHAQSVGILLDRREGRILLIVEDDGIGFDPAEAGLKGHLGLVGIRERAEMLGGGLQVETIPGGGSIFYVTIPDPI